MGSCGLALFAPSLRISARGAAVVSLWDTMLEMNEPLQTSVVFHNIHACKPKGLRLQQAFDRCGMRRVDF